MKIDCTVWQGVLLSSVLGTLLILIFLTGDGYQALVFDENGPIQLATAMLFLTGMVTAVIGLFQSEGKERAYFAIWGLLCLVFVGEETSWLQHQLGYATPELIASRNVKGESNLHNLDIFHGGELLGNHNGVDWTSLAKAQHLFQIGFFTYFLALPAATLISRTAPLIHKLRIPYPGWRLVGFIWLAIGLSIALTLFAGASTKPLVAETRELIYAASILVFLSVWIVKDQQATLGQSSSGERD